MNIYKGVVENGQWLVTIERNGEAMPFEQGTGMPVFSWGANSLGAMQLAAAILYEETHSLAFVNEWMTLFCREVVAVLPSTFMLSDQQIREWCDEQRVTIRQEAG